ncbi:MAG: hypothetical protein HQL68_08080 [Magnetococcales bacterium]|nr:hypothetical protein [Magnetococcales bacterium]
MKTDQGSQNTEVTDRPDRRNFLSGAGSLAITALGVTALGNENINKINKGPKELPLHEADFYAPHSEAG